jgi:O-antigen ligase
VTGIVSRITTRKVPPGLDPSGVAPGGKVPGTVPAAHARSRAGWFDDARARRLAVVVLVACGLAVAAASTAIDRFGTSAPTLWLLAAPLVLLLCYLASLGPKWSLAFLIAAIIFGLSQTVTVGSIDLRVPDIFYVILFGWALVIRARDGQRGHLIGRPLLALWFATLGLSLYLPLLQGAIGADALIPWLRLVATFSLVWLVPYALRSRRDLHFVLGALGAAATVEVGQAVLFALLHGNVSPRLQGTWGANATGLIAVWVVILAIHGPVPRQRSLRLIMLVVGAVGLLMTRSLGSTAALVVALGLYGLTNAGRRRTEAKPGLITPYRLLFVVLAGLVVATTLRPTSLPGSAEFRTSNTAQRLVMADAGLRLFAHHPITGTGWQRSPDEVRATWLNDELRRRWEGEIASSVFPRSFHHGATVHNSYVQILAEAGAVGFLAFLAVVVAIGIGVFRLLRDARADPSVFVSTRAAVILLVATMVWLNDNPLFGSQPETVMAAMFLGILAAVPPILVTSVTTSP